MIVQVITALGPVPGPCEALEIGEEAIFGDYFFDERAKGAVFLTHVYEQDGEAYAMMDIADFPFRLELENGAGHEYRINLQSGSTISLTFSGGSGAGFEKLRIQSDAYEMDFTGTRYEGDILRLRGYHAGRTGPYVYRKPLEVEGGWEVGTLAQAGIDVAVLYSMMNDIYENYDYIHSILIVKDGKLVFEEYANGWDPVKLHRMQSVSKSVTSTLTGIAMEQGFIGGLDDPLCEYLPEYAGLLDGKKRSILLKHLLTMSAGFEWNELETYYADPEACDAHIAGASGDFIKFVLERPLAYEPGTKWCYNSGLPNMLGYIITQETGMNLEEFSCEYLFEPLGIERSFWQPTIGEGRPSCAGGLRIMSRDMARLGLLYLRKGKWNGRQVVPEEYVVASTSPLMDTGLDGSYGYMWWTHEQPEFFAFLASGTGGQYIVCIPALDTVVVTTAVYKTAKSDEVAGLLLKYVVPAVVN
jgi:CubicO group peptidase (beta-lactamase class C family)